MRPIAFVLAVLLCAAARGEEARTCQPEQNAYRRAVEAYEQAQKALSDYDSSPLAPVVPGQADAERKRLQDAVDQARDQVLKTSETENDCFRKKACKKLKPGWSCIANYSYDRCCLDGKEPSAGGGGRGN